MNAKFLIVALCAFQLAAGGFIDSIVAGPFSMMDALFNSAHGQAASVQQQFQDLWQSVNLNVTSQIDFQLRKFNSSQNDACTNNLTQQYYSTGNKSLALIKAGFSIFNETIRNGSKILIDVSSRINNAIPQAISNFTKCISSNKGFMSVSFAIPTCGIAQIVSQFAVFANTTNEQTQRALLIFNSTVNTLPQLAAYAAQILFSAGTQMAAVSEQAMQCMVQTVNGTFA